jgi:hypothetical protein
VQLAFALLTCLVCFSCVATEKKQIALDLAPLASGRRFARQHRLGAIIVGLRSWDEKLSDSVGLNAPEILAVSAVF